MGRIDGAGALRSGPSDALEVVKVRLPAGSMNGSGARRRKVVERASVTVPTSSSHYFKETIKGAERRGIDADLLLRDVGLTRREVFDPAWRGDVTLLARLVQLVWYALDDEHMGFLARPAKPGIFALMTHTLIAEQSVEQALRKGSCSTT